MNSMKDAFTAARAAALFVSDVSVTDRPTGVEVDDAIRRALRTHGGSRGCAADLAAAYGERPELAALRMRWALGIVESRYARPVAARRRRTASIGIDPRPATADRPLVAAA